MKIWFGYYINTNSTCNQVLQCIKFVSLLCSSELYYGVSALSCVLINTFMAANVGAHWVQWHVLCCYSVIKETFSACFYDMLSFTFTATCEILCNITSSYYEYWTLVAYIQAAGSRRQCVSKPAILDKIPWCTPAPLSMLAIGVLCSVHSLL